MASSPDNTPAAMPPRPGSEPGAEIDPQLESALRNLNVNLEDELTRYRRQRHGRVPPPPPPRRVAQRKTLDLISVAATEPSPQPPAQPPTPPPPPPNPFLKQQLSEPEEDPELAELEQMMVQENSSPEEETVPEAKEEVLPVPASDVPTEGYLESSEELLKSIADEQAEPESIPEPYSPDRKSNSLLKLAGLVLVLLGGIGVGFAITYPSQLQNLRSQIWPAGAPDETESSETTETTEAPASPASDTPAAGNDTTATTTVDGYKPPGPDLSTREFKELDDVQDLVTLDLDTPTSTGTPLPPLSNPAQTPIPTATPPATTAQTSPSGTASPTPAPAAASNPSGTTSPTTATPGTTAPNAAAPSTPAPTASPSVTGSNFYVVASYTGDASLNKARELVPDAFVRNFKAGARIQLAAFDNRAQAEDQVSALTQQGAAVELFGPTNE